MRRRNLRRIDSDLVCGCFLLLLMQDYIPLFLTFHHRAMGVVACKQNLIPTEQYNMNYRNAGTTDIPAGDNKDLQVQTTLCGRFFGGKSSGLR